MAMLTSHFGGVVVDICSSKNSRRRSEYSLLLPALTFLKIVGSLATQLLRTQCIVFDTHFVEFAASDVLERTRANTVGVYHGLRQKGAWLIIGYVIVSIQFDDDDSAVDDDDPAGTLSWL